MVLGRRSVPFGARPKLREGFVEKKLFDPLAETITLTDRGKEELLTKQLRGAEASSVKCLMDEILL